MDIRLQLCRQQIVVDRRVIAFDIRSEDELVIRQCQRYFPYGRLAAPFAIGRTCEVKNAVTKDGSELRFQEDGDGF